MTAWRRDRGQASLELIGMAPLLALAALTMAQALLIGHTALVTEQAARTGARVAMVTDHAPTTRAAAVDALPSWLQSGASVTFPDGRPQRVSISSPIPTVVPGVPLGDFRVTRVAEMPEVRSRWD